MEIRGLKIISGRLTDIIKVKNSILVVMGLVEGGCFTK